MLHHMTAGIFTWLSHHMTYFFVCLLPHVTADTLHDCVLHHMAASTPTCLYVTSYDMKLCCVIFCDKCGVFRGWFSGGVLCMYRLWGVSVSWPSSGFKRSQRHWLTYNTSTSHRSSTPLSLHWSPSVRLYHPLIVPCPCLCTDHPR